MLCCTPTETVIQCLVIVLAKYAIRNPITSYYFDHLNSNHHG